MNRYLAALALAGAFVSPAEPQCDNVSCGRPGAGWVRIEPTWHSTPQVYRWVPCEDRAGCWAHYLGDVQVGFYDEYKGTYRSWNQTTGYGPEVAPPWQRANASGYANRDNWILTPPVSNLNQGIAPGAPNTLPATPRQQPRNVDPLANGVIGPDNIRNHGIVTRELEAHKETRYSLSGNAVTRDAAVSAIGGKLADDSNKFHVCIIGSEEERKRVVADFAEGRPLAKFRPYVHLQAMAPDNFLVSRYGFKTDGHPTIYLEDPRGKVLHRQDDYRDGPAGLALAIERKADPNYQPKADPDARKNPVVPFLPADLNANHLAAGGLVLAALLWFGYNAVRKQQAAAAAPAQQAESPAPARRWRRVPTGGSGTSPAMDQTAVQAAPPPAAAFPPPLRFGQLAREQLKMWSDQDDAYRFLQREREADKQAMRDVFGHTPPAPPPPLPTSKVVSTPAAPPPQPPAPPPAPAPEPEPTPAA